MRICNYCRDPLHSDEGISEPYLDVCLDCMSVLENQKNRPEEYEKCVKCHSPRFEHMDDVRWGKMDHEFESEYV
jgi:hypothetical protein